MKRETLLSRVRARDKAWDLVIIGGGATGVGCAVDATSRGFDVLLLEQHDFGKGTSSRSTKLAHGGVRYLKQGNISLVRQGLRERGLLLQNAPHIVYSREFVVPCYSYWQRIYYGIGLRLYDMLSGKYSLGKSRVLSKNVTLEKLPTISRKGLVGGVAYYDGQFDDTRLLIDLVKTASENNGCILNYSKVLGLTKTSKNKINGVDFECMESGEKFNVKAKLVINATGVFCDQIRQLSNAKSEKIISPSQGIHLVFDGSFLKSKSAIMIPKTSDGRVLFAIPWYDKTLVGTTDTPIKEIELEPKPLKEEIEFILRTCETYLARPPKQEDVLSVFVGIRPLVKSSNSKNTASLSRDHTIEIDDADLLTVTGGKWTSYRSMAEDTINTAIELAKLPDSKCVTQNLRIRGKSQTELDVMISRNPELAKKLHKEISYKNVDIIHAVRNEMARTVEDVLARRTRVLFLNAKLAAEISAGVAETMAKELNKDASWVDQQTKEFRKLAGSYLIGRE